jgi:predicted AAA+ superfamily ATPase
MKSRDKFLGRIQRRLSEMPIVALLGTRQVGKTTLALQMKAQAYFDLDNPQHEVMLQTPESCFQGKVGLIVIDEVQKSQKLFSFLRYWVDQHPEQKFLLLGSASRELVNKSSESLAGRISYIEIQGFGLDEIDIDKEWKKLWQRGGYPRSFLAQSDESSNDWRLDYIRTFLERDIPQLGIQLPAPELRRFWTLLSHANGQLLNYAELGRSFGLSDVAIRRYVEVLQAALVVRCLQPWHENIGKRQVKRPKLYLRDTGLSHTLQGITDISSHPKLGASWESFIVENLITMLGLRVSGLREENFYFWRSHTGEEIDLFFELNGKRYGFEVKYNSRPQITPSMRAAKEILGLTHLYVIAPLGEIYSMSEGITVCPISEISKLVEQF